MNLRVRLSQTGILALGLAAVLGVMADVTTAQSLPAGDLVATLRRGGNVLVMRHASSPSETPTRDTANADNQTLERQLDDTGRRTATAMGRVLRDLNIPIGEVFTSPAYRAIETTRFAQFGAVTRVTELGEAAQSMQSVSEAQAAWLRAKAAQLPARGNAVIVTHSPNLALAFPQWGSSVAQGETVIVRRDRNGQIAIVARIKIEEWPRLRD